MACTFAPNATLGGRVSLRARSRCPARGALMAPARVAPKTRGLTTRAVKEVSGADFQAEVLDVSYPQNALPCPLTRTPSIERSIPKLQKHHSIFHPRTPLQVRRTHLYSPPTPTPNPPTLTDKP
jgi:hypothetical protein